MFSLKRSCIVINLDISKSAFIISGITSAFEVFGLSAEAVAGTVATVGILYAKTANSQDAVGGAKKFALGRIQDYKIDLMLNANDNDECVMRKTKILTKHATGQYEKVLSNKDFRNDPTEYIAKEIDKEISCVKQILDRENIIEKSVVTYIKANNKDTSRRISSNTIP